MKKFLLLVLLLVTLGASAQPILTASGVNPVIGDHYYEQSVYTFPTLPTNVVTGGANRFWDFSFLVDSGPKLNSIYISPVGTPRFDSFPTATIAAYESTQKEYYYFLNNNNQQAALGSYKKGPPYDYSHYLPQLKYLSFPMSYQKTFTETSTYYDSENGFFPVFVKSKVVADGYGNLKLPNATYSNVLRLKLDLTLTVDFGGGLIDSSNTVGYYYYTNGIHEPLLFLLFEELSNRWKSGYYYGTVLPLNIHDFTTSWRQATPMLQWKAENIIATKGFTVQRSKDGSNFETIGWVDVNNSNSGSTYQYFDYAAKGSTLYYRLIQEDKNGERFFSNTLRLQSETKEQYSYQVFPNPAHDIVHLSIPEGKNQWVKIFNLEGKKLYENRAFSTNESITVADWAKGTYLLVIYTDAGAKVSKFEKF